MNNTLFRNSLFLILATGIMAVFGFFFWLISARLASPEQVGLATALISVMSIIAAFSLAGFDSALIRFLPNSKSANKKINTAILLVGGGAIVLSTLFLLGVEAISPKLAFIRESAFTSVAFVLFCTLSAVNILTDAIFIANRRAGFVLVINFLLSFVKVLLPFALAVYGAFGIFVAAGVGQGVGFLLSIWALMSRFGYRPAFAISRETLREVWRYSLGTYSAGTLALLPASILPILIAHSLGAPEAAYFYIVMMIGNVLYIIPQAASRSFVAEGSHNTSSVIPDMKKSFRFMMLLLVPAVIFLLIFGDFILGFFGKSYASEGTGFLNLIALSGLAAAVYATFNSYFRVSKNIRAIIATNALYAVSAIGLSFALLPYGLLGIGTALLLGTLLAALLGFILYRRERVGLETHAKLANVDV